MIKGIDVVAGRMVSDIAAQVDTDIAELTSAGEGERDRAILGKELALGLGVSRGDVIRIIIAQANISPLLTVPKSRQFEVAGIADAGFYDYDSTRVYLSLEAAQRFIGLRPWQASAIEARVERSDRIQEVAREIQVELGDAFYVNDLVRMNRTFFSALRLEKLAMSIAIGLIILVAALNIVSVLVLMVMEKVRDIGVLSAMGATSAGIRRIFLLQGLIIASLGTLVGAGLGVTLAWTLDHHRLITLPADVYFIPYVPFHVRPLDVLGVIVMTIAVAFLATLYPSWRASRLDPSEALRYE
jgi:lipoprotein-releasing system permease protein